MTVATAEAALSKATAATVPPHRDQGQTLALCTGGVTKEALQPCVNQIRMGSTPIRTPQSWVVQQRPTLERHGGQGYVAPAR
jgi:hypothetical protein